MPKQNNALEAVCTPGNKVRETYYGDTYRAKISIKSVCQDKLCDILHISIPFSPEKEVLFMQRFDVSREELPTFYRAFAKAVLNHTTLIKELNDIDKPTVQKAMLSYLTIQSIPKLDRDGKQYGSDLYLITEPMESFIGSDSFSYNGATLKNIVSFGIRMLQTIKTLNDFGYTLGAIDLDSCYLSTAEKGQKLLKTGYMFYGAGPNSKPAVYTQDVAPFINYEELASGMAEQSTDTDIYMLCGLLWAMLDGRHYTSGIRLDSIPKYAPEELVQVLQNGIRDKAAGMKALNTGLRSFLKKLNDGSSEDVYIAFEPPLYFLNPLPEKRVDPDPKPEPEEPTEQWNDTGQDAEEETGKQKKQKILILLALFAVVIGVVALSIFSTNGPFHEVFFSQETPVATPIATAKPTPKPKPTGPFSDSAGIYVGRDNKILNQDGSVNDGYELDAKGNICWAGADEIVFTKENCSEYQYIDKVSIGILNKDYSTMVAPDAPPILKDHIIDLSGTFYEYDEDADFEISKELQASYELQPGMILQMRKVRYFETDPDEYVILEVTESKDGKDKTLHAEPFEFTDSEIYKAQGQWWTKCRLTVEPAVPTNNKLLITSDNEEYLKFAVMQDGKETYAKGLRLAIDESGTTEFTLHATVEGKHTITIESEDGYFKKQYAINFEATENAVIPTPTPVPTQVAGPNTSPEPTPIPTPVPTPTPQPQNTGGNTGGSTGGYTEGNSGGYTPVVEQPVYTPTSEPVYEPVYTPEPTIPDVPDVDLPVWTPEFTVDQTYYTIGVGETITITPSLGCIITSSPPGIVTYPSTVVPFQVTGVAPGTCIITLTCTYDQLSGERIDITVNVVG